MQKLLVLAALVAISFSAFSQNTVSGIVSDNEGNPVIGAHVTVANSYHADFTDENGRFSISRLNEGQHTLMISHVSFEKKELTVEMAGSDQEVNVQLESAKFIAGEVQVAATRITENTPMAHTNLDAEDLEKNNLGVDIPYLLETTPSVVVTSDAGNGIGYTGIRIRGSDPTRTNVTINGIPLNDTESQGVFWVDLPDFATSVDNVQIQRGVGTSTNGAGAFGASINLQTNKLRPNPYGLVSNSYGSFNSRKHTVAFGTGLIKNKVTFDARFSKINSDGFIDRATSDLKSFFVSGAYLDSKNSFRVNVFSGKEVTYQAWGGVPGEILDTNRTYNPYTYENEVDDYLQTHYQAHYTREFGAGIHLNLALFYTHGEGFFEQFREGDALADYGLEDVTIGDTTISHTDLIRRRWLDNDFYGATFSLHHNYAGRILSTLGGAVSRYDGQHFGEVIWAQYASNGDIRHRYYDNDAIKYDFNIFGRVNYEIFSRFNVFADLQYRRVDYEFLGLDNSGDEALQGETLHFFNPKLGVNYDFNSDNSIYFSYARGNKEPNRNDYTESTPNSRPEHETLDDFELGYRHQSSFYAFGINTYFMKYKNQLVLTGQINDVGAYTRTNIPDSYRMGIELEAATRFAKRFEWKANATLSRNRIKEFVEYVDSYDENFSWIGQEFVLYENVELAFSPDVIANSEFSVDAFSGRTGRKLVHQKLTFSILKKYVGQQHFDNSESEDRKLDGYFLADFRASYVVKNWGIKEIAFTFWLRNVLGTEYESNAWVYRYVFDGQFTQSDGYYPQAGRNYLVGLTFKF